MFRIAKRGVGLGLVLAFGVARCASSAAPAAPSAVAAGPSGVLGEVVDLTNRERAAAGLTPLRFDQRLGQAAQLHADQMMGAGQLEHVLPTARYPRLEDRLAASQYQWRLAGENLAVGQDTAGAVVESWMQSAEHREVILTPAYVDIGVGRAAQDGRTYYVQVFARP